MHHSPTQKDRAFSALGILSGCAVAGAASVLMAQSSGTGPGGGNPGCFENTNQPACDFYVDQTPDCADTPIGGGTCGTRYFEVGLSGIAPANATCLVLVSGPDGKGGCISYGLQNVGVGCSVAAGAACS